MNLPDAVIGRAYRSRRGWRLLEEIVDRDRMAGHDGEKEAATALAEALATATGGETQINTFDITGWWRDETTIEVDDRTFDAAHEVVALPNSPASEGSATVVDVGHGTPEEFEQHDVEDKYVLATRGSPTGHPHVHRWEKYGRSVDGRAAGFILGSDLEGCLPPTGHIGAPDKAPAAIPGVGVSQEVAAWLRRHEPQTVSLSVSADSRQATSQNVEAILGPNTDEEVLVTAHLDAHDVGDGAEDNGLGCAALVEIAATLSMVEDDLDTRVRFVGFGAEEVGIQGSARWVSEHDLDAIKAVMNVDTAGTGRTLRLKTMGFDAVETAVSAAAQTLSVPVEFHRDIIPDSDHWPFVQRGVPAVTANSVRETEGRGWGHTHGDTLDKLDQRDLRETAIVLSAGVLQLAAADVDVPHTDPGDIQELIPENHRRGLEVSGRWPF
ncbi:M28 family peptidase [Halorussus sp. AFM4]|uniref:M28 family peptidase n=1 Tax=Halorussus sp. AFM4 TaxID=3421651 RepID=UPI003EC0958E